jgi:hypothetical protein
MHPVARCLCISWILHYNGHNNWTCVFTCGGALCDGCREYLKLCSTQANERSSFKAQARTRHRRWSNIPLPPDLQGEMPSFASWLQDHVKGRLQNGLEVDVDLMWLSRPPKHVGIGNHYRIDLKSRPTHLTYDSSVACIFKQASQSSLRDQNMCVF